ncbi:hypothetical protein THAOC_20381 [Thalassiosira oceanica]|uniref:Uncharacterized protein n=1 Tax=Thalassiosira oceanica TaxID=159749 RepID=K0RZX5_THAOC|nr:hypothetical protein THAOC_20381 [Thalassiosira oceanica]|eukprot:EJK59403.1 hypothetical protein THAOC_20381 [Thalassiosira oceanica]
MKSNNITHLVVRRCYLGIPGAIFLFNTLHDLNSLEQLWIDYQDNRDNAELNDAIMAECILTLSACTGMQKLTLNGLNLSTNSFAVLRTVFPRMSALLDLGLCGNLIDDVCARDLVHGQSKCTHLQRLSLSRNIISDNGLDVLIQGLPKSVDKLHVEGNDVTLARQVPLLRFKNLFLSGNTLCLDGPGLIAASLANPECRLESLTLTQCNIGDEEAATLADGLRNNRRLTRMSLANNSLANNNITKEGWNAFSSILCDSSSIIATYNSNHTLQSLGLRGFVSQDIEMMLDQNRLQDKSRVAANKILLAHRHLDMSPLFGSELDLLPRVVAWLDRFAKSRPDLKLSSIFEFVRAMPMKVTARLLGMAEGKKRKPSN